MLGGEPGTEAKNSTHMHQKTRLGGEPGTKAKNSTHMHQRTSPNHNRFAQLFRLSRHVYCYSERTQGYRLRSE